MSLPDDADTESSEAWTIVPWIPLAFLAAFGFFIISGTPRLVYEVGERADGVRYVSGWPFTCVAFAKPQPEDFDASPRPAFEFRIVWLALAADVLFAVGMIATLPALSTLGAAEDRPAWRLRDLFVLTVGCSLLIAVWPRHLYRSLDLMHLFWLLAAPAFATFYSAPAAAFLFFDWLTRQRGAASAVTVDR